MKKDKEIDNSLANRLKRFANPDAINSFSNGKDPIKKMSLSKINDNQYLHRAKVNKELLDNAVNSIKEHGIASPLLIRKTNSQFEVVYPRLTYLAAKKLKIDSLPCVQIKIDDEELLFFLASKLLQQKDSSVVEMSYVLNEIKDQLDYTQKEIADALGLSRSQITNIMRLINMPESILNDVGEGRLSFGHVRAISALKINDMVKMVDRIYDENLSVHEIERIVYEKKHRVSYSKEQKRLEKKYKCDVINNPKRVTFVFESDEDKEKFIKKIS